MVHFEKKKSYKEYSTSNYLQFLLQSVFSICHSNAIKARQKLTHFHKMYWDYPPEESSLGVEKCTQWKVYKMKIYWKLRTILTKIAFLSHFQQNWGKRIFELEQMEQGRFLE